MLRVLEGSTVKLLCGLMIGGVIVGLSEGAIADEVGCYMTTVEGVTLSLSHLCRTNVPTGAYLTEPEPVPSYVTAPSPPTSSQPVRRRTATAAQPQRNVTEELPFLGALPPLPPLEQF